MLWHGSRLPSVYFRINHWRPRFSTAPNEASQCVSACGAGAANRREIRFLPRRAQHQGLACPHPFSISLPQLEPTQSRSLPASMLSFVVPPSPWARALLSILTLDALLWRCRGRSGPSNTSYDIHYDGDMFIGLTHEFLWSSETNDKTIGHTHDPMPPGGYVFSWSVVTGPICWNNASCRGHNGQPGIGSGQFNFTVADDAPWPNLRDPPCASMAAKASFAPTSSSHVSWVVPTTTPLACYEPQSVTEPASPCRATVSPEEAKRISSIMTWIEGAPSQGNLLGLTQSLDACPRPQIRVLRLDFVYTRLGWQSCWVLFGGFGLLSSVANVKIS
jgi:hypothetical protein